MPPYKLFALYLIIKIYITKGIDKYLQQALSKIKFEI